MASRRLSTSPAFLRFILYEYFKKQDSYGIARPLTQRQAWQHGTPPPDIVAAMPLIHRRLRPAPALLGLLLVCCLMAAPDTLAKKKSGSKASHKSGHASSAVQRSSSEETRAERERRLLRECRGRPNAGACLGYAS
ncbi:MAG: hypothetical protein J0H59_16915 [Comamonadaceae bacterium]|nr:hypothetical protein [Comamonadaceae bacterium]